MLANDPPILIADEPTGNLDSTTADSIFSLFEELASEGKTIVMVTHDNDLARRVNRTVIVVDGRIVNQYVATALPGLDLDVLSQVASSFTRRTYPPGSVIVRQGDIADHFYVVTNGRVEVVLEHPSGQQILVDYLGRGQYFGEIALLRGIRRTATVRVTTDGPVEVMALDATAFHGIMSDSDATRESMNRMIQERLAQLSAIG